MAEQEKIIGLILAGGRSTRMGGGDKALLTLNDKPMVEWVIERLRPQVDSFMLNSNQPDAQLVGFGYPIVADAIDGYPGPLAGLHVGLAHTEAPLLVMVPCDAPLLPADLVARLHRSLTDAAADVAVARTQGGLQPTFLLCRTTLRASIEVFLANGGRALHQWLAQQRYVEVVFADEAAFSNVNTPQDLQDVARRL